MLPNIGQLKTINILSKYVDGYYYYECCVLKFWKHWLILLGGADLVTVTVSLKNYFLKKKSRNIIFWHIKEIKISSAALWCLFQYLGSFHLRDPCDRMSDWLTDRQTE